MCRRYQQRSVPRAVLLRVLEAARRSPSAGNSQGVRFAVVTGEARRKEIAEAYGEVSYRARGFPAWLSEAPVHVVAAVCESAYEERYSLPDKRTSPQDWPVSYPILDTGKALMSLYIAAEASGLACGYLGPHAGPDLIQLLDLPPEWRFMGLVTVGYRHQDDKKTTVSLKLGRRDFDDMIIWV